MSDLEQAKRFYQNVKGMMDEKIKEFQQNCAQFGFDFNMDYIAYKSCNNGILVLLYVPSNQVKINENRSQVVDKRFAKFRAEKGS